MRYRSRFWYGTVFLFLMVIEVLIAIYIHGGFIRNYLGDILAVIAVYFFVKMVFPRPIFWLPAGIFLFSCMVEISQRMDIVHVLGLEQYPILRILVGSQFDWKDILCYGVGCLLLWGGQRFIARQVKD